MTATDKVLARALIRGVMNIAAEDNEAADMSAAFDGGEWSARYHGPGSDHVNASVVSMLDNLGITPADAILLLDEFTKLHSGPDMPVAYEAMTWIQECFIQRDLEYL